MTSDVLPTPCDPRTTILASRDDIVDGMDVNRDLFSFLFFKAKITGALVVLYLEYSPVEIAFCFSSYRSIRVGKSQGRMDDLEMEREVDGLIARPVFVLLERGGVEKRSS
jgi:hypothetical protein